MGILQARKLEWWLCPPPGDLPNPGIKQGSPALQVDSLPTVLLGKPDLVTADELMRVGPQRKLSTEELMLLNWGAGEAS